MMKITTKNTLKYKDFTNKRECATIPEGQKHYPAHCGLLARGDGVSQEVEIKDKKDPERSEILAESARRLPSLLGRT